MGGMFGKFKGHLVSKGKEAPKTSPLNKAELQARIDEKRKQAKSKEPQTGEQGGPEGPEPTAMGIGKSGARYQIFNI